jgi:DNA segregation ATPase FtsK/SpoIIIE, S-DNA-T family
VREVLRRVHRLMLDRQASIAQVLGVTDAWPPGPSPSWPLVLVVVDEAHTVFHERKGTSPEIKAHNALVVELSRLVEELIRKGRNVAIQVLLLTQRATGDAIPTRIRDNCQAEISVATRTVDGAVAALSEWLSEPSRPRGSCLECLLGGVRVLVGPPVFKTGVSSDPAQAGSIPVRLR